MHFLVVPLNYTITGPRPEEMGDRNLALPTPSRYNPGWAGAWFAL